VNRISANVLEMVRVLAALVVLLPWVPSRGQFVTAVPNSLFLVEGNTNNFYPFWVFWPYTGRYQQVYAASQFSLASNGGQDYQEYFAAMTNGGWISDIYFRFDGGSPSFSSTVSNVEIHLSTTQREPDGLSQVFSDNVGPDDTIVFSGSFILENSSRSTPEAYESHIALRTNFWYDPSIGNLLLDVRVHQGLNFLPAPLDAVAVTGDSVSSVSSTNDTSGIVNTTGLVTFFEMAPPPILQTSVTNFATPTNYLLVTWLTQPTGFVLQVSISLADKAGWQTLPGTGSSNVVLKTYKVSIDGATSNRFFRLARPGGP
jgi:hypothetical protein